MKIGILWKSNKENERRYPIYWEHLENFTKDELENLYFEENYPGLHKFSHATDVNYMSRENIFKTCDLLILPKPTDFDLSLLRENQILWGWPHTVQGHYITDVSIQKKLTIIAWENMFTWSDNTKKDHVFARNNEMAGYAAVNHFMELQGITPGAYGKELKIAIMGYGSTSKGAINSLIGLGALDITVFSKREKFQIVDAIKNVKYKQYKIINGEVEIDGKNSADVLMQYDLILNCVLQDPISPLTFLKNCDLVSDKSKKMIIDISCDNKMGFDFATPTSFDLPIIETDKYIYYAVDHTPSYYWNSASYEVSGALIPYLDHIIKNGTYKGNIVLERAVDIESGEIRNKKILKYQKRNNTYPYEYLKEKIN